MYIYRDREYILGTLEQFGTENYTRRLDIIQNLCKLRQFYFSDFLRPRCLNTPYKNMFQGEKFFNTLKLYTTYKK